MREVKHAGLAAQELCVYMGMMSEAPVASQYVGRLAKSKLPKVLMLTHAMGGGVARHLAELSDVLEGHACVLQLKPQGGKRGAVCLVLPGPDDSEVHLVFSWPEQQDLLWRFLAQISISQVHVHHVLNWPASFWDGFLEQKIPFDLTLHDYCIFSGMQRNKTADKDESLWLSQVQRCFSGETQAEAQQLQRLARIARRVFVPSRALYDHVQSCLDELGAKLEYHPHPEIEGAAPYPAPFMRKLKAEQPLRVLCLGMLSAEKGAQVLSRAAREAEKQGALLEFHLLGSCHVHLPQNIKRHGSYHDDEVPGLLEKIDPHVLWLPAQCPETWSYTLSAGLKAGLPVVATRLGVFPERLQERPLSWLCDVNFSTLQWLDTLLLVRAKHMTEQAGPYSWRSVKEPPFYTSQCGYLLDNVTCFAEGREPLEAWQIEQALVLGLPEAKRGRTRILRFLLKLKYSRTLAPLVGLVPYAWQRRIKRKISREPLYEPSVHDSSRVGRNPGTKAANSLTLKGLTGKK